MGGCTYICSDIVGIEDPLRDGIKNAVGTCNRAGIKVLMCTSENIETARAIALQAGIITEAEAEDEKTCMTGESFEETVGGFGEVTQYGDLDKLRVLAGCSPEQKLILVTGL